MPFNSAIQLIHDRLSLFNYLLCLVSQCQFSPLLSISSLQTKLPYFQAIAPSTAYKRQTKRENVRELTADQIPVSKTDFLYKEDSYFHA